jgi:hypothetical protein
MFPVGEVTALWSASTNTLSVGYSNDIGPAWHTAYGQHDDFGRSHYMVLLPSFVEHDKWAYLPQLLNLW